ncbi:MAG TPA: pentapeptide repeat-containing protein [Candidatus Sericytochromatia bacterium]
MAKLDGVNLSVANLRSPDLEGANLKDTNRTRTIIPDGTVDK